MSTDPLLVEVLRLLDSARSDEWRQSAAESVDRARSLLRGRLITPGGAAHDDTQTVTLRVEPDWTWDECIVCGSKKITDRSWVLHSKGRLAKVGWCSKERCQDDRERTTNAIAVDAITPPKTTEEADQ